MTDPFDDDVELAEYEAAQRREYAKWEAAETIMAGNALVYTEGHAVPLDNVERLGYAKRGQVRLQPAYIAANPDDPDVKTFHAFAKKYPEHPAVRLYERYQEAQSVLTEEQRDYPALTFGADPPKAKTSTEGKPDAKPDAKSTTTTKG